MCEPHFVVLKQEQIGALSAGVSCADLDEAVKVASEKTEGDKEPRYVVQVMYRVQVDPKPRVIVTPLHEEEPAA
ncbi:MAG TPA: hypothetical protein PKA36_17605 [Pseudoxanthomonas mexicana]|nr:hypothetical protein [Pseudoxanthomonas mexicana]